MSRAEERLLVEDAEELFEDAPCGYISTRPDGTIIKVNRTFESWIGRTRDDLCGATRLQDLLAPGARIYHETHYAPLLQMQGEVREIAVEFIRADGSRLPALLNSVMREAPGGTASVIRTTVFDASERRRYERELLNAQREQREIAHTLQSALLKSSIPPPGMEVACAHRSAVRGAEVGGDWHDAFEVDGGRRAMLVVGDVMGQGVEAAAEMGQLRSATRALAASDPEPDKVLCGLDHYCVRHRMRQMTTMVCATVDLCQSKLHYACAAHLPPLVARPAEPPQFLWEGRSLPLATPMADLSRRRPVGELEVEPSTLIVLYTDGLVERRREGFDPGLERLRSQVEASRDLPADAIAQQLMLELLDPESADDSCVLVARLGPQTR